MNLTKCIELALQQYFANLDNITKIHNLHDLVINQVEKQLIIRTLTYNNNNKLKTAKMLGINRNTLHKKIQRLKITLH